MERGIEGEAMGRLVRGNITDRANASCAIGDLPRRTERPEEERIASGIDRAPAYQDGSNAIRTRDGSLAAHCEHTLVIMRGKPLILAA